jgi:hypothetical protein
LTSDIPKLMEELPSEKDTPEVLRRKMGQANLNNPDSINVPVPSRTQKFGKSDGVGAANPFGYSEDVEDKYW